MANVYDETTCCQRPSREKKKTHFSCIPKTTKSFLVIFISVITFQAKFVILNHTTFFFFKLSINRLLVGAPTAQTEQPGVNRGGAVFRCSTEVPDQCLPIPFDTTGISDSHFFTHVLCNLRKQSGSSVDVVIDTFP